MKKHLTLLLAAFAFATSYAQETSDINQKLQPFNKVVVSHKINLILIPGDQESIRIEYMDVDPESIIIDQSGHRLHIYLENAKFFDIGERRRKNHMFDRRERYRYAQVRAYVTFKALKLIEIRGEGDVVCDGNIESKKLKVRAYGENSVRLARVEAGTVKARLYGENTMRILEGEAGHLSYKLYGENKVDTKGLVSVTSNTTIYGEGRISLNSTEEVRVNSFGEPSLYVTGSPHISKGIIVGRANIRRN